MKLKKIASLLLAGVMAVSMLAGCSSSSSNDVTTDVDEEAATTYSSTLYGYFGNKAQGNITAVENTDLTSALTAAVNVAGGVLEYSEATTSLEWLESTFEDKSIEKYVMSAMDADYDVSTMIGCTTASFNAVSVAVISGGVSDFYALKSVVSESESFNSNIAVLATDSDDYDRSYTISASVVSSTDSNGVSVKFVAVMVSGTITAA